MNKNNKSKKTTRGGGNKSVRKLTQRKYKAKGGTLFEIPMIHGKKPLDVIISHIERSNWIFNSIQIKSDSYDYYEDKPDINIILNNFKSLGSFTNYTHYKNQIIQDIRNLLGAILNSRLNLQCFIDYDFYTPQQTTYQLIEEETTPVVNHTEEGYLLLNMP